ncbi:MAG: hypothetical protein IJ214_03945 [Clostridia bacterium]|nr:hypothetical protein [Clostridia bacterium]
MKKLFALLLALCMLGSCVAFAEAPAEEADPQAAIAEMIDQAWYTALSQLANTFNTGATYMESLLSTASDTLNTWITDADSRYTDTRSALADAALQLMGSANEVIEEAQYITNDSALDEKAAEIEAAMEQLMAEAQQLSAEAADGANTRLAETKDQVVASASSALGDVISLVKNLLFVVTGSSESEAQTRMGEVSDNATDLVTYFVDMLQESLNGYAASLTPAEAE